MKLALFVILTICSTAYAGTAYAGGMPDMVVLVGDQVRYCEVTTEEEPRTLVLVCDGEELLRKDTVASSFSDVRFRLAIEEALVKQGFSLDGCVTFTGAKATTCRYIRAY